MDTQGRPPIQTIIRFGALHNEATSYRPGDDPVELDLTAARDKGILSSIAAALCDVHGLGSKHQRDIVAGRAVAREKIKAKQRKPERPRRFPKAIEDTPHENLRGKSPLEGFKDDVEAMIEASVTKTSLHLPMGA